MTNNFARLAGAALAGILGMWTTATPSHAQPGVTWSISETAHVSADGGDVPGGTSNANGQYTTAGGFVFTQSDPSVSFATVPAVLTTGRLGGGLSPPNC